ncbi:MAG: hypothetical protein CMN30_28395 [Sandaracinus sp.]|nr:hypothetical protein [Sandaracinus sp.]|tara:strand:- start:569 stop:1141 length:573 start_codon:yes stop_codon:yes gene_type:complete
MSRDPDSSFPPSSDRPPLSKARPNAAGSMRDTAPPATEDHGSGPILAQSLRPCGVLVVESDPDLQWRLARMLTVEGNRVVGTSSGDGALALVSEWPVDLVLVSDELPGMEGIEVIRHLHERCPDLVSLLLADDDTPDLRAAARLAGATACIRKPKDAHQLVAIIGELPLPAGIRPPVRLATDDAATDAAE